MLLRITIRLPQQPQHRLATMLAVCQTADLLNPHLTRVRQHLVAEHVRILWVFGGRLSCRELKQARSSVRRARCTTLTWRTHLQPWGSRWVVGVVDHANITHLPSQV